MLSRRRHKVMGKQIPNSGPGAAVGLHLTSPHLTGCGPIVGNGTNRESVGKVIGPKCARVLAALRS
jgi:hypothetical protein